MPRIDIYDVAGDQAAFQREQVDHDEHRAVNEALQEEQQAEWEAELRERWGGSLEPLAQAVLVQSLSDERSTLAQALNEPRPQQINGQPADRWQQAIDVVEHEHIVGVGLAIVWLSVLLFALLFGLALDAQELNANDRRVNGALDSMAHLSYEVMRWYGYTPEFGVYEMATASRAVARLSSAIAANAEDHDGPAFEDFGGCHPPKIRRLVKWSYRLADKLEDEGAPFQLRAYAQTIALLATDLSEGHCDR